MAVLDELLKAYDERQATTGQTQEGQLETIMQLNEVTAPESSESQNHKSPAKIGRDRERFNSHQQEKPDEDSIVGEYLTFEKHLLEATAFRDQLQSKGEVVATINSAALSINVADVLRDRKRHYVHPSLARYGFL